MVSGDNHVLHVFPGFSVRTIGVGRVRENFLENPRANCKFKPSIKIPLKPNAK